MFTLVRILFILVVLFFAAIGLAVTLIVWSIKQDPMSIFHWLDLLRQLIV